ncbi:MAG: 23S rRNA (uracil(1939)-C(5))-methyltransferase RlmD [Bacillota bacterium]
MNPPVTKNQQVELEISALASEGQGIGRVEGYAVFVAGALPGERVLALIIKATSSYAVGKLLHVLMPAKERVEPRCTAFGKCGGCSLQHLDYAAQLQSKRAVVRDALERIGGFTGIDVLPVIGMADPWEYRNKGAFPFASVDGCVQAGFFAPRSHRLIPLERCDIEQPAIMEAVLAIADWANEQGIAAYDEETGRGSLRHAVVRTTRAGDVMAAVVTAGRLIKEAELVQKLTQRVLNLKSIVHNLNPKRTNVIFGDSFRLVWGREKLTDELLGIRLEVSAASFLQVNPEQTERLYEKAIELAALTGRELVVDLYCGIGSISLALAQKAESVIGIESVPEAIADANANALLNNIQNARFLCAAAEEELPRLVEEGLRPDVIVLDPPRKGAETEAIRAIAASGAPRVVYVSCNPASLARDAKLLGEYGYALQTVQPVDMFAHSAHVESVVLMLRVKE